MTRSILLVLGTMLATWFVLRWVRLGPGPAEIESPEDREIGRARDVGERLDGARDRASLVEEERQAGPRQGGQGGPRGRPNPARHRGSSCADRPFNGSASCQGRARSGPRRPASPRSRASTTSSRRRQHGRPRTRTARRGPVAPSILPRRSPRTSAPAKCSSTARSCST